MRRGERDRLGEGRSASLERRRPPARRPTMVDVANEARVSQTTVSLGAQSRRRRAPVGRRRASA